MIHMFRKRHLMELQLAPHTPHFIGYLIELGAYWARTRAIIHFTCAMNSSFGTPVLNSLLGFYFQRLRASGGYGCRYLS